MLPRLLPAFLAVVAAASAQTAQESFGRLLATGLDAEESYRVRDVFLEREDVKLYLTDGVLIFGRPIDDRVVCALFIARQSEDVGETIIMPSGVAERQSVARYTGQPVLNEKFRSALMFFTDDSAAVLRGEVARRGARRDVEEGRRLAERWSPIVRNILETLAVRILADVLSEVPVEQGFFAAAIGGGRLGRFDVVVDPRLRDQVFVGQTVWRDNRRYYETWCNFEGRSFREGRRKTVNLDGRLENYRIEARFGAGLEMDVRTAVDFYPDTVERRGFTFAISRRLRVDELLIDGEPADYFQINQTAAASHDGHDNVIFLLLPEKPADPDVRRELEFRYSGQIVSRAGDDVYFVGDRGNWYPQGAAVFTNFTMRFDYPASLDLVAGGERIEFVEEGGRRIAAFRSPGAIRLAGFNLGRFERAVREVDGLHLEVLANREAEDRLKPRLPATVFMPNPLPAGRRRGDAARPLVLAPTAPKIRPADRIEDVADQAAAALRFFTEKFGPPPVGRVLISPIPGDFGQGFPGLVYASTLSYFAESDRPLANLPPADRLFYSKLLLPHEISHQWWGNAVSVDSGTDVWILEALATYSSLLWLERDEGPDAAAAVLETYRRRLLTRDESGERVESAGAVVFGERLRTSKSPSAYRAIVYEKGAWIFHMLRGLLGDEAFFQLLRKLTAEYGARAITTADLRAAAAASLPPDSPHGDLRNFFDQWVQGVGIPTYSTRYEQKQERGGVVLRGELIQEDAPDHFSAAVPVRAELIDGRSEDFVVVTDGPSTSFSKRLSAKVARLLVDPEGRLLAARKSSGAS